ncbi:hypothetical protein C0992_005082 [Termitomyces sp. T32_za158]|nr:hypothetical protein C0992_005082 [Termitomyces sp. T32_za158]
MPSLYDDSITNFFRRVNSKETPRRTRKRKRAQDDVDENHSSDNKEPKVQQKLVFSNNRQAKGSTGLSRQRTSKAPSLKRGESSNSKSIGPYTATPSPVDALSRVSSKETSFARHKNPLPTPLTAKRPVATQMTRSFLVPDKDQPMLTPRPTSPASSAESSHSKPRRMTDLPTPVTMPRRAIYPKPSPPRRGPSPTPSWELSPPKPSQVSSIHPLSSDYEESVAVEEGQQDEFYNCVDWESPLPSQNIIPSSQSQADGCFDSTSLLADDPEPSTSPHSPVFLTPRLPDKILPRLSRITNEEDQGQTLNMQGKQPSSVPHLPVGDPLETSLIEIHDGEEYVLSSQSQLVLPFHVSPRKDRRKLSSSSSSIAEDTAHSDEIVPSSQSQFEKELDETSSSQTPLASGHTFSSSSEEFSTSTQILVEETPEEYYDLPLKDQELSSATEEESGDEDDNMFPFVQSSSALKTSHESVPSSSQESMSYPSSLPDAIKEFREMFGVGDGSYPDDFPMSLRD